MQHKRTFIFLIIIFTGVFINTFIFFNPTITKTKETSIKEIIKSESLSLDYYKKEYSNEEIVAKLKVSNLFNILITQSKDNEYYLNHSINKKSDKKGTEFMDYRVNIESRQINIYGHNSKTYDIPFRKLELFLDKNYFDENKYLILEDDTHKFTYQILLIKEITSDFEHMKVDINSKNIVNHINKLKENSIHSRELEYNSNSDIIILQTCSYNKENSFYIIVALKEN